MKLRFLFMMASWGAWLCPAGWAADLRFSQALTAQERSQAGVDRLSGPQSALLDALVARGEADLSDPTDQGHPPPADFSRELAPDKRHSAGLDLLSAAELGRLDGLVQKRWSQTMAERTASKVPWPAQTVLLIRPEVHGEIGFMVAAGSHGYSAYGGYVGLSYADLAKGYEISAFHSETHVKGAPPDGDCIAPKRDRKRSFLEESSSLSLSWQLPH